MNVFRKNSYSKNDPVYLQKQEYEKPKEFNKALIRIIQERFGESPISIIDAGCAAGAFMYFAKKMLNLRESAGFDISDLHLEQARQYVPDVDFFVDDLLAPQSLSGRQYDVCTFLGAMSIFDDFEVALQNLLGLLKAGGALYIYDILNDDPVDMIMRFRLSKNQNENEWQSGFNLRSRLTYEREIRRIIPNAEINFIDFKMPFAIPRSSDPMRAWTITTEENPYQITVGTKQLLDFKIVEVIKPVN